MNRFVLIILLTFLFQAISAQVVNIEKKRIGENDEGFSGKVDLSVSLTETENRILQGKNNIKLQYKKNRNTLLLFNNISLIKADEQNLINDGFQHLRYNYKLKETPLTWEVFAQHQYNTVKLLKRRILAGSGPRIHILNNDTISLFFGPIVMYENEILTDDSTTFETFRMSNYISFAMNITDVLSFNHISYYQPDIKNFDDFRISSESTFKLYFTDKLSFSIVFNYSYDSKPPTNINKAFYSLSNTLTYNF
jgi:putative salt-induced outer membrane protein YdiY